MGARTVGPCWTFSRLNKVEVGGRKACLPSFKAFRVVLWEGGAYHTSHDAQRSLAEQVVNRKLP